MADFLLEIGTEELPSRFLKDEEKDLATGFKSALDNAGIEYGTVETMATPRRLTLIARDVSPVQAKREEVVMGPPARIAYDEDGTPTKALEGFAKNNNVPLDEIFQVDTDKGPYMAVRKIFGGAPTAEILAEICPSLISGLSFPKRMRWGNNDMPYARPMRWILALLDSEVIPFSVGPLKSGRQTWGHRIMGAGPFDVPDIASYDDVLLNKCAVVLDPSKRRSEILEKGNEKAHEKGGEIIWNDRLLDEVCGLVEHPVPLLGDFDSKYLDIPEEVLLTSMETHQKSFGVRSKDGKLLPHFLTVLNIEPKDIQTVKHGWERVLRARLEDARFFWESDKQQPLQAWQDKLENVIFIGPLGSMAEKSRRLAQLCGWLVEKTGHPSDILLAQRAGTLAKVDLVSGMVGEFDTLQGIMGAIYARLAGENEAVAAAISEQYLPAGPESPLPDSYLGAILAIADKADTLAGCFGLGMIPTGVADPNGLRRCALGIIRILLNRNFDFPIGELFSEARKLYGAKQWKLSDEEYQSAILEFFKGRLRHYLLSMGHATINVDAILDAGFERVPDCLARLEALEAFEKTQNYIPAVQTLKRVENISKKIQADLEDRDWKEDLLEHDEERKLSAYLRNFLPQLDANLAKEAYTPALSSLENLRKPVDDFFDNVMVLCDDPQIRNNRLRMLNAISSRYGRIARFSALQI